VIHSGRLWKIESLYFPQNIVIKTKKESKEVEDHAENTEGMSECCGPFTGPCCPRGTGTPDNGQIVRMCRGQSIATIALSVRHTRGQTDPPRYHSGIIFVSTSK